MLWVEIAATAIIPQCPTGSDHTVAGIYDRDRIGRTGRACGARRSRLAGCGGEFTICHHRAVRNAGHGFKPGMAGGRLSLGPDRQPEILQCSAEIGDELIRCFT